MLAWGIVLRLNHGHMFTVRPIIALDKLKFDRIEDEKKKRSIADILDNQIENQFNKHVGVR